MFLSMLTADAAAQHGHEYSNLRVEGTQRRSPIPRNPFSVIAANRQRQLHGFSPLGPGKSARSPARSQSVKVTMAEIRDVPADSSPITDNRSISTLHLPGSYPRDTSSEDDAPTNTPEHMEQGKTPNLPEREETITPASTPRIRIEETLDLPLPIRLPRAKRQYRLAHPPPSTAPKKLQIQKHIRPKVLLQLQHRTPTGFHRPVYEVVPASRLSTDTKLGRKFSRWRKRKDGLHADDLVVVKVDDYKGPDDASEEAEFSESRTIIGSISLVHGSDDQAEDKAYIQVEDSTWIARAGKRGGYNLVLPEDETLQAKWYVQKKKRKRPNSVAGSPATAALDEQKFYFALMQPFSRQHPTLASINAGSLDVYEHYAAPSSALPTSTRPSSVAFSDDVSSGVSTPLAEDERIPTSESLRKLIVVSGAWMFFASGWSPFFKFSSSLQPSRTRDAEPRPLHTRSASMPTGSLLPPAVQWRAHRDSSPSSISKTSARSSTVQPVPEEQEPTSSPITDHASIAVSASLDISPLATGVPPSPIEHGTETSLRLLVAPNPAQTPRTATPLSTPTSEPMGTQAELAHQPQTATLDAPTAYTGDSSPDSDAFLQSPSYWQAYDLFHERSLHRKLEKVNRPTVIPREESASSTAALKVQRQEASAGDGLGVSAEPKPLRRASTLRERVKPYFSMIKSATQRRIGP